jgi:hypothetical protein
VLDTHVVVAVSSAVGLPKAEKLLAHAQVDDLLRPAIARIAAVHRRAERAEHGEVERRRALDVADREIDVVDGLERHLTLLPDGPRA